MHKKGCSTIAAEAAGAQPDHSRSYSAPRVKGLEAHVSNPFTRLDRRIYLHDRSESDTFKLLIDSFRMRQADDFDFESKTTPPSVYTGAPSSTKPFLQYLADATKISGLLPPWWTDKKNEECVAFGKSGTWSDLRKKVTKSELVEHYGEGRMPMQLRMLAECVYGTGPMGQDGSHMRKMMMQMENGGLGKDDGVTHIDLRR